MDEEDIFYNVRLGKKGELEVFNGVYDHSIDEVRDTITIKYAPNYGYMVNGRSLGFTRVATRRFSDKYKIEVGTTPEWLPVVGSKPKGFKYISRG